MSFTKTESFNLAGDVARSQASTQLADAELKFFANFSSSGQLIVPVSGDTYPPMSKLVGLGCYFPGVGVNVAARLMMSGGISGGIALNTLNFNSGFQVLTWIASGPSPTAPINLGSGPMFQLGLTNQYLLSGARSSGAVVMAFVN